MPTVHIQRRILTHNGGKLMSVESTAKVMQSYWGAEHDDVSMMADDVVFTLMADGSETHTPQGVLGMLNYFYHVAFDATFEKGAVIVGDGHAMIEGFLAGKHIGEFAGVPPTGRKVRVPMVIVYDVEGDLLKRARIYFEMPALMAQLGVTE